MKPINVKLTGQQIVVTIDENSVVRSDNEGYIRANIISEIAKANGVHVAQSRMDVYYFNGKNVFVGNNGFKTVEEVSSYIKNFCYPIIEQALIIHESKDI